MFEPKIIAYLCTWCSYTGADTAGIARLKSPANIRAVRVPCSGRVSPELIMRTFDQGADGVLVLGCHIGECHYESGNHRTARRIPVLSALMEFSGLEPARLRLDWVSASEGERFSRIVSEFTESVRQLGPVRWRVESQSYAPAKSYARSFPGAAYTPPDQDLMQHYVQKLQDTASELLASGQVDCVIGYETSPRGTTRPTFVYNPKDAERLVWNQDCTHNLTTYLNQKLAHPAGTPGSDRKYRVGVLVKPCDERAINVHLAEKRYERDQVYLIGMACEGIQERARNTGHIQASNAPRLQDRCLECPDRVPQMADVVIGEEVQPVLSKNPQRLAEIDQLRGMTPAERMEFWLRQFDRCIRCYACRQACPVCDCPTCLYERDDSLWVSPALGWEGVGLNEKRTFHLGRAYHLAGRCIGCDECERACPMDIPISFLNQRLAQEMEAQFKYKAGVSPSPPPFVTMLSGEEGVR